MKVIFKHNLDKLRAEAIEQVEATISLYRLGLVTGGPLQLDVYRKKLQEAEAVLEDGSAECIFLKAEAAQRDISLVEMANLIIQRDKEFTHKLAEIETFKVEAVQRIMNASSPEEIRAAAVIEIPHLEKKRGLVFKAGN